MRKASTSPSGGALRVAEAADPQTASTGPSIPSVDNDRRIRVLVNATALRLGGGGTYIVEQLAELSAVPGVEITVYAVHDIARRLRAACGAATRVFARPDRGVVLRVLHEQLVLPFRARSFDVVYQPASFAMFMSPRPQAVTSHNAYHFGASSRALPRRASYPWRLRVYLAIQRSVARASVRRADAFITLSKTFQSAVEDDLGRRERLHVLPSPAPKPASPVKMAAPTVGEEPYALTVAHDYLHKDWDGLIRAFIQHDDLPRLVIAGAWRGKGRYAELRRLAGSTGDPHRVTLLGPVSDRGEIAALYRGASCFIAHSFLEAAPLTPGEAVAHGVRLIASDIAGHREAAGTNALYYDPRDPDGLAAAVQSALTDLAPVGGLARGSEWTWGDNAATVAEILRSIAEVG